MERIKRVFKWTAGFLVVSLCLVQFGSCFYGCSFSMINSLSSLSPTLREEFLSFGRNALVVGACIPCFFWFVVYFSDAVPIFKKTEN